MSQARVNRALGAMRYRLEAGIGSQEDLTRLLVMAEQLAMDLEHGEAFSPDEVEDILLTHLT